VTAGEQPEEVLADAVASSVIPGAVFASGARDYVQELVVVGQAMAGGGPARPMRRETLFDLASLTKVVATLPSVLLLAGVGKLDLDGPVCAYVPAFTGAGRERVTIRQLLCHTSGLPGEVLFWRQSSDADMGRRAMRSAPLEVSAGARVEYSDVGFMLLGDVVEAASGLTLDAAVAALVTEPLKMTSTCFNPGRQDRRRAAATELGPGGKALIGVVHDENARFFGGVMGHAGLFSTVDDLVLYLRAWVPSSSPAPLLSHWCSEACREQTAGLNGRRGLGWVLRGDAADFLGDNWPPTSVSHTGFTGTSLALDPVSGSWAVLLTNDVHFGRGRGTIRALRRRVHVACRPVTAPGGDPGAG
jgi:CubicO group peptidase (beta-lactamase class C family)